ncbi:MAG: ABC transporter ATP-binding protein [Desulfobulbaceae bacterium]|uniref:ABC transporter ATP-binding protein n=1 Tax=Candidatus Desulfobia pelagia TaxID=2841692 RepID=A0A8J6N7U3_9BACT|nr:ABC transporter ATP-binding protein [Candidatus Desulfobia pelagia]
MILDVQGVSFAYNCRPILSGVHFSVNSGEILAILGPNGVGKTSLLKCINAIHRPGAGIISVDGRDILQMQPGEIAREISYVAQQSETTCLTVFDAILMGRKPYIRWKVSDKDLKIVDAAIKRLHLEDLTMRYINQLSGGELQKVAIARALVQEPLLLLLDEPTSALDLKNQYEILSFLRRVVEEHNLAAVMTMHDLNTAMRFAHKFLFLKEGGIYAHGKIDEISSEMIGEVYGLPVDIHRFSGFPIVVPHDFHMAAGF